MLYIIGMPGEGLEEANYLSLNPYSYIVCKYSFQSYIVYTPHEGQHGCPVEGKATFISMQVGKSFPSS